MVSPMLVNLSIAFDEPDAEDAFNKLLQKEKTLFVAAAGNGHEDLNEHRIYPASLGGKLRPNFMTVASIDSTGRLSAFSNYGEAVDIAAPGCKISSWLDAERPDVALSGSSQAAPLVTFAAALLLSKLQPISPRAVKNRLIYSGDLIQNPDSRKKVWSHVRLAIPKALFVHDDFLFVREGTGFGAYLGEIERFTGVTCAAKDRDFDELRSLKRVSPNLVFVYTETAAGPVSVCEGKLADHTAADPNVPVTLTFHARAKLRGASIIDAGNQVLTVSAADVVELVRRMPDQ
jgi:subtilisin family serine protease